MDHEAAIVGAGPIGLELAAALRGRGVDLLHLDAGQVGQTISWYPRQTRFFSSPERIAIAGVPLVTVNQEKATREEYLAYLRGVVEMHSLDVRTFTRVTAIEHVDDGFVLNLEDAGGPRSVRVRYAVLAVGDMHHARRLNIPGEDLPHVSHYFEEPHRHFRRRLLIVGGRNSAVEAALRCYRAGAHVSISYRRDALDDKAIKYWLLPEIRLLIDTGRITFLPRTQPTAISATHVQLAPTDEQGRPIDDDAAMRDATSAAAGRMVEADDVLLMTGYEMDKSLFTMAGVELSGENQAPVHDERTMQTNVPGLYVAGTAAAGTQHRFSHFIENSHKHVAAICRDITGQAPPFDCRNRTNSAFGEQARRQPES